MRIIPMNPSEKMPLNVLSEVNYQDATDAHLDQDFDDCIQFDCLLSMADETDEPFQHHYMEIFNAWNIMHAQLERVLYPWKVLGP